MNQCTFDKRCRIHDFSDGDTNLLFGHFSQKKQENWEILSQERPTNSLHPV